VEFRVDQIGALSGCKRTPQGGLEAPANLTRTGIFLYHKQDGTVQKEYRPANEVFNADSLATLAGAPLTVGHPGLVRTDNWKQHSVGHVGDEVKPGGRFVQAKVRVQDATTVAAVERKDLVELSCGYTCDLDHTPGEFEGEKYDAIQRNIRYNHVALGAKDFGRAGTEVRLRLDGALISYANGMDLESALKEIETLKGQLAGATARADAADKKLGAVDVDALVAERLSLVSDATKVVGAEVKFDGKSDAEVMSTTVAKAFPEIKLDGCSQDFVRGLFKAAVTGATVSADAVAKANVRVDSAGLKDAVADARGRNEKRSKDAWKGN
jgi:hypothetical protein